MELPTLGRLIAQRRRDKGLTLRELAAAARVGRSTLAALESGKLAELGFNKVARLCAAVDLVLEARPPRLEAPLIEHRHLTEVAGRDLTKAAIEDVIVRGDIAAWRGLVRAAREDQTGRVAERARQVAAALSGHDAKARAFANLLPALLIGNERKRKREHDQTADQTTARHG
ncbi:MAG TPA: helix-turn-helix domain-containing protein [Gammaproteobacteria bacterium]|nr:helix-turn-helix domain-containing protein [Gammaproteobacteria bacterium]